MHFQKYPSSKKYLFVVMGHFIKYSNSLLERSDEVVFEHSFFVSGVMEWSGKAFWERSEKRS